MHDLDSCGWRPSHPLGRLAGCSWPSTLAQLRRPCWTLSPWHDPEARYCHPSSQPSGGDARLVTVTEQHVVGLLRYLINRSRLAQRISQYRHAVAQTTANCKVFWRDQQFPVRVVCVSCFKNVSVRGLSDEASLVLAMVITGDDPDLNHSTPARQPQFTVQSNPQLLAELFTPLADTSELPCTRFRACGTLS